MKDLIEKVEYKGFVIEIYPDFNIPDPRKEWDNAATIVCFHRRYNLGDEHNFRDIDDVRTFIKSEKGILVRPVYMYDHSGISLSCNNSYPFNDLWDAGQVGIAYMTANDIRKTYLVKRITKQTRQKARELIGAEVNTYNQFLNGEVFYYSINDKDGEIVDSCGGFYGWEFDENGLLEYARDAIDGYIENLKKEHYKQLKRWIISKTPLQYRKPLTIQ